MIVPMTLNPRKLTFLAGGLIVAFGLLYWASDTTLGAAIGITAVFAVIGLVSVYF